MKKESHLFNIHQLKGYEKRIRAKFQGQGYCRATDVWLLTMEMLMVMLMLMVKMLLVDVYIKAHPRRSVARPLTQLYRRIRRCVCVCVQISYRLDARVTHAHASTYRHIKLIQPHTCTIFFLLLFFVKIINSDMFVNLSKRLNFFFS